MADEKKIDTKGAVGCITIVLLAGFWLVGRCGGDRKPDSTGKTPEKIAEDARKTDEASIHARMDKAQSQSKTTCSISIAGIAGPVLVFPTEEGYDEFGKASATKDKQTIDIAARSNGAYWVAKGTKCLWLDRGLLTSKVRVLEGPHAGKIGWMDREWSEGRE
ncbi:MAG TPA: hypothetical protein VJN18_32440 [Polyangiaceae bacterium]|nr:hypothetical protein [Polyangiaceae bacterium]